MNYIAVICLRESDFMDWINEVGERLYDQDKTHFKRISRPEHLHGHIFHAVEKGFGFFLVRNYSDLYERACKRIINDPNRTKHEMNECNLLFRCQNYD